jgi:hypothetical protein
MANGEGNVAAGDLETASVVTEGRALCFMKKS